MKIDVYLDRYLETEEPTSVIRDIEAPDSHNSLRATEYQLAEPNVGFRASLL